MTEDLSVDYGNTRSPDYYRDSALLGHTVALTETFVSSAGPKLHFTLLPEIIRTIYDALAMLGQPVAPVAAPKPEPIKLTARQIADAVQPDSIFCFEDGKRYKSMKRTLALLGLTPKQYRVKWGLPDDFPIVAPAYSAARSAMAKNFGLGVKR